VRPVRVTTASSAGHPGRPNEDFMGVARDVMVLLDGAGIPGAEHLCRHGVVWYSHALGSAVLGHLASAGDVDLAEALADSIDDVARRHRDTCDLADPSSPQASVAIMRVRREWIDYLALADAYVVLAPHSAAPRVITDGREVEAQRACAAKLDGLQEGTAAYARARSAAVAALRAQRNRPGGYWIAKEDPHAAEEAVTGTVSRDQLAAAALLSNGASRIVDTFGLTDWTGVMDLMRSSGPEDLLRWVRQAEAEHAALSVARSPDDASAAYCDLTRATQ
jgi:hypothetical protein